MTENREIRLHQFLPISLANGPGKRAAIWFQGCTIQCPGCFNSETHNAKLGTLVRMNDLIQEILCLREIEGITISGGEPFQQSEALADLITEIRNRSNLSILVFSGYPLEQLLIHHRNRRILSRIDVLIAGPYKKNLHLGKGLLGSSNQKIHFLTSRYTAEDLQAAPDFELIITPEGDIIQSGIQPVEE